jgi:hypothetical protein
MNEEPNNEPISTKKAVQKQKYYLSNPHLPALTIS